MGKRRTTNMPTMLVNHVDFVMVPWTADTPDDSPIEVMCRAHDGDGLRIPGVEMEQHARTHGAYSISYFATRLAYSAAVRERQINASLKVQKEADRAAKYPCSVCGKASYFFQPAAGQESEDHPDVVWFCGEHAYG